MRSTSFRLLFPPFLEGGGGGGGRPPAPGFLFLCSLHSIIEYRYSLDTSSFLWYTHMQACVFVLCVRAHTHTHRERHKENET